MGYTKVYWRPSQVPTGALVVLALISIAGLLMVETMRRQDTIADYGMMAGAARAAQDGMAYVRELRQQIRLIDTDVDPLDSGLIGVSSSPVTSLSGHLPAKQTSVNPNWAAVALKMLREAGVNKGDVVAVAVSGSFPALNLSTYAALEELGAIPIIIVSGSASTWGANVPGLIWIDMARELRAAGLLQSRAVAASLGGAQDRGIGVSERGKDIIRLAIKRAELQLLLPATLEEAVAKRAKLTKMITTTPNKDSVVPYPKQTKQEKAIEKPKIYSIEEYATQSGLAYLCAEYFPNRKKVYRSIGKHYKTLALKQGHKRDAFESMAGVTALTFSNFDKSSLAIVCKDLRLTDLPKL